MREGLCPWGMWGRHVCEGVRGRLCMWFILGKGVCMMLCDYKERSDLVWLNVHFCYRHLDERRVSVLSANFTRNVYMYP